MIRRGIFWGIIISIPFWLLAIWLIKSGVIALKTLIILVLILSAPYIFLIMRSQNTEQDKQDRDLITDAANDNPAPSVQSSDHHQDPSDTGTPG
ncbi:MAG: hypothetical protein KAI93_06275 [Desulfobacterales bacterium]|nr:hypothetical protein [Desulfobacterales bacterium]